MAETFEIKPGDLVRLKYNSDAALMTVQSVTTDGSAFSEPVALCIWWNSHIADYKKAEIYVAALDKLNKT